MAASFFCSFKYRFYILLFLTKLSMRKFGIDKVNQSGNNRVKERKL